MTEARAIVGKECRFAIHMPTKRSDVPDLHLVKEVIHYEDGSIEPNVHFEKDYKRSFYVTKKPYRNHQQKKEYEVVDKLLRYECTESELQKSVARALDKGWSNANMRQLSDSPYLYGSDVSSTTLIKQGYAKRWPDTVSDYTVAYFDIETDVVNMTNDPVMATIIFKDMIFCAVTKDYVKGFANPVEQTNAIIKKYIGDYVEKYNFKIEVVVVENTVQVIQRSIAKAHEWLPDFLAIWNMDFDVPRMLETLEKYGVDPKNVFSHPAIPEELRFCKYKKGSTKKITASGQVKPKNPSEQWHSLYCPAGFYIIDAMCTYRFVRQGEQELPYYSLDYILNKELGLRKLKFDLTKGIVEDGTLDWHIYMQERHPLEYIAYNFFDCIGMMELELRNFDLSQKLPVQAGFTDFPKYTSQTKKFSNKYYFFLLEQGKIVGTVGQIEKPEGVADDEAPSEDDDEEVIDADDDEIQTKSEVMSLKGWIVTLPSHMSMLGKPLIENIPSILTMIRTYVYDSDAVSAYPSCTAVANVSRETTVKEIIEIIGIEEVVFRRQNINLLQGHVNALEYVNVMHKLPKPQEALSLFSDM